jgi:hypothetical protein
MGNASNSSINRQLIVGFYQWAGPPCLPICLFHRAYLIRIRRYSQLLEIVKIPLAYFLQFFNFTGSDLQSRCF